MAIKIKRALISVSNKEKIVEFAKVLQKLGVQIISTGGTYKKLIEENIKVFRVEDETGFPEMMDGRVKTLHPFIHAGILADRSSEKHMGEIKKMGIKLIDLVVVNLYPFKDTVQKEGVSIDEAVENIDIGGPTMIRSAAKNYKGVAVIVDPADYQKVADELTGNDCFIGDDSLFRLSVKAFQHTCEYDSVIFGYFSKMVENFKNSSIKVKQYLNIEDNTITGKKDYTKENIQNLDETNKNVFKGKNGKFNDYLNLFFIKKQDLRYGENPHQKAAYYKFSDAKEGSFVNGRQLQGKELSYNNILDSNAAFMIVREFKTPCVVVIKHNNPCGAAASETVLEAYKKAYECDPLSAFGGIVGCNVKWTAEASEFLMDKYIEVLIAPEFENSALKMLEKKENLRILKLDFDLENYFSKISSNNYVLDNIDLKSVEGGILVQDIDEGIDRKDDMRVVTDSSPDSSQWEDLLFGWQIAKNVKSNAIVLAKGKKTVGIGAGQMSRIDAAKIAIEKAGKNSNGSVLASDAFFPFEDAVKLAKKHGILAIIQPGGSVRDNEVINFCNKNKMPMVFTGKRHFKH